MDQAYNFQGLSFFRTSRETRIAENVMPKKTYPLQGIMSQCILNDSYNIKVAANADRCLMKTNAPNQHWMLDALTFAYFDSCKSFFALAYNQETNACLSKGKRQKIAYPHPRTNRLQV